MLAVVAAEFVLEVVAVVERSQAVVEAQDSQARLESQQQASSAARLPEW